MSAPVALDDPGRAGALSVPRPGTQALLTVGLAAILCAVAFVADGGLRVGDTTPVEMALLLGGGLAVSGALLLAPRPARAWGLVSLGLFAALAALTALSIAWAANPADAWLEANRTLTYTAVFAAAVALAHAVPGQWSAVIGGITLAAVAVSAYAVATRIFPGALSADEIYARLREPFGYWNSVGLMAAAGVPGCLWLGARRSGHQALNALAFPALGLLVLTILLAYSRGALLAAVLGAAFWFATVPLRLRGAAVLLAGSAGAGLVAIWAFGQGALTEDRVPVDLRTVAGHQLGLLLIVMLGVLALAGLLVSFVSAAYPPGTLARRRATAMLLTGLALLPVAATLGLATGEQGVADSISSRWEQLTDPSASTPPNDPGRLTAAGSVRARYWNDALKMFQDHPAGGAGAGAFATVRPRYRTDDLDVRHAHGYVVQTLGDLGIAGLLVSLALLLAWSAAAARATGLALRRRPAGARPPDSPERIGLLTLVAVVVVFGVHSFVDWTWFVPANALVAVIAAGWVAGRGPRGAWAGAPGVAPTEVAAPAPGGWRERLRAGLAERRRAVAAAAVLLLALVATWAAWQPLRSAEAGQDALAALDRGDIDAARAGALAAGDRNPLSVDPLFELSVVESAAGRKVQARAALARAVRLQPANPESWLRLAEFELYTLRRPDAALTAIRPALFLDPRSPDAAAVFLAATRRTRKP